MLGHQLFKLSSQSSIKKFKNKKITVSWNKRFYSKEPVPFNKDATKVRLSIQTSERPIISNLEVDTVGIPGSNGDLVVGPKSVPTLTELRPGVIRIKSEGQDDIQYFTSGGFAVGLEDSSLQMSLGECVALEDLDLETARSIVSKWQGIVSSTTDETAKAMAQITYDTASALVKALESK